MFKCFLTCVLPMDRELIIESSALTKMYVPHLALDSLDIRIEKGATGLLGPNGAGKSTFLKTILGLIQVTSGEGSVLGYDIRTQGEQIRQRIGYMPEYDALNPNMEAIYQVKYCGELIGMNPNVALQRTSSTGVRRPRRAKIQRGLNIFNWYEASDKTCLCTYSRP